jgi:hypothetical protein
MRILLDENAPSGLRRILARHDVRTAPEMGRARYSNGQLLDEAEKAGFEALITGDRSLPFQHNLTGRNIAVIIFSTNAWPIIRTQPQTVQRAVANASPGTFTFATFHRPSRSRRPPAPTCYWCKSYTWYPVPRAAPDPQQTFDRALSIEFGRRPFETVLTFSEKLPQLLLRKVEVCFVSSSAPAAQYDLAAMSIVP